MSYRLVSLDAFSTEPKLQMLLESLGRGALSQRVAQAASWHLSDGMSWEQLAAKKIDRLGRPDEPYFSEAELLMAHRAVAIVTERAAKSAAEPQQPSAPSASQASR
jgi:hypothetical protein